MGQFEHQVQMSDDMYRECIAFMRENKISLREFAEQVRVESYLLEKIMDRAIKMYCYPDMLVRILKEMRTRRK